MDKYCRGIIKISLTIILSSSLLTARAEQSIMVRDDIGDGVKSNVYERIGNENTAKGITSDTGILFLEKACDHGKQIKAVPVNPLYYEGYIDCSPGNPILKVAVTKKYYISNLQWNADIYSKTGQVGKAALAYNELFARLIKINPQIAVDARDKAYVSFARAIDTPSNIAVTNFDVKQGKVVLTHQFVNYLKTYQVQKGIPATGSVDYLTLSAEARIPVMELMYEKILLNE